jgi:hypothetical protein
MHLREQEEMLVLCLVDLDRHRTIEDIVRGVLNYNIYFRYRL